MEEKIVNMNAAEMKYRMDGGVWMLEMAKSQTRVKDARQLGLLEETMDLFLPVTVEEGEDVFTFSFRTEGLNRWEKAMRLSRSEKLRLLHNLARFRKCFDTRFICFFHPQNLVFDENLMPFCLYRGIRGVLPPYEQDENEFLYRYKCLAIGLFSKKYTYDELYAGSLDHVKETEFERRVAGMEDVKGLAAFLYEQYLLEKKTEDSTMQTVSKKQFRLFKRLSYLMITVCILFAIPLAYFTFIKFPFQQHLLAAHYDFLSENYSGVISDLSDINPEKLPAAGKYVLAYSYVKTENIDDEAKTNVMNNISLKSDPNYLLYWIYNGRGNLNKSLDLALYMNDPVLIVYTYLKKVEQAQNDPHLSGAERESKVAQYEEKAQSHAKKYGIPINTDDAATEKDTGTTETDGTTTGTDESVQPADAADIRESATEDKKQDTKKDTKDTGNN
ncbi:type VII secretion protein EssB [Caldifermentibacillus hisashii]|uniref:Type VII secretion protein EssB n=1 Tax=Caldifermentibacillus hisashii TaxID=996558 RepID=A0ABU9K478_9BACI